MRIRLHRREVSALLLPYDAANPGLSFGMVKAWAGLGFWGFGV